MSSPYEWIAFAMYGFVCPPYLIRILRPWACFVAIPTSISVKNYAFAVITFMFYDYLLTLQDEVQYIWEGRKSWVFYLYLINRYATMIYFAWLVVALNYTPYTVKLRIASCEKVVITEFIFLVLATLVAQVLFVARLYAVSGESRKVLAVFAFLTVAQLALGVVFIAKARNTPSFLLPTGPRVVCIPDSRDSFKIRVAYTFFSLAYDTVSLLTLMWISYSTCGPRSTWPTILGTITKDSAFYFLGVLGSHCLVVLYMIMDPASERYFSSAGIAPLAQVMISRLVLSLRKAGDPKVNVSELISGELSFSSGYELPTYTLSQVELPRPLASGPLVSSDAL